MVCRCILKKKYWFYFEIDDESDSESEDFDSPESDSEESQDDMNDGFDENVICAIPTPIPLPPMDSALRQAIKEGRLRDKSVKSRLVRISVDFYMSMKRYPSKEDYNNICNALITAYPDLRDPLEIPGYPPFVRKLNFTYLYTAGLFHLEKCCNSSLGKLFGCLIFWPSTEIYKLFSLPWSLFKWN